jgi:carotenoid cleavage dioxygenase-like enzyme
VCRVPEPLVRTPKFLAEQQAGHSLSEGFALGDGGVANTNILSHAGRLLALEELHAPIEIDPATLRTVGERGLGGGGPVTAHPKIDPETGEMRFFGYSAGGPFSPAIRFGSVDRSGRVTALGSFEAPYCSMVHDFLVTRHHVVFPIMPLAGSLERARRGAPPFAWQPELGGYVGIMRLDSGVESLRWFRAETGFVFHVMNAWQEDDRILADVMRYEEPPLFPHADGRSTDPARTRACLCRWTIDPDGGTDAFLSHPIDDLTCEFPRIDDRRAGRPYRHGWFAGSRGTDLDTLAHLDRANGKRTLLELPEGDVTSEPVFAPRTPDAAEGDGWLLAVVWRCIEQRSELIVLQADAIQDGPVATVRLPRRVPFGFHGNWETV